MSTFPRGPSNAKKRSWQHPVEAGVPTPDELADELAPQPRHQECRLAKPPQQQDEAGAAAHLTRRRLTGTDDLPASRWHRQCARAIRQSALLPETKHLLLHMVSRSLAHPTRTSMPPASSGAMVAEFGFADWTYVLKTEHAVLQQAIQHAEDIGLLRLDPIPYFKETYFLRWTPSGVQRQPQPRRLNGQPVEEGACEHPIQDETESSPQHWKGRPPRRVWQQLRQAVLTRDERTCHYCGTRSGRMTCDHQIPVSRGGSSTLDNLVTACLACNSAKATRTAEEWMPKRPRQPHQEVH